MRNESGGAIGAGRRSSWSRAGKFLSTFGASARSHARRLVVLLMATSSWIVAWVVIRDNTRWVGGNILDGLMLTGLYLSDWCMLLTTLVFSYLVIYPQSRCSCWLVGQILIADAAMLSGYWSVVTWQMFYKENIYLQYTHGIAPLLTALYWCLLVDHRRLSVKGALLWLMLPVAYTIVMETIGFATGRYPYHQLNPFVQGRLNVAVSIAEIIGVCLMASLMMLAINKYLSSIRKRSVRRVVA